MPDKIAIVGTGLVGSAWAIVFARAGHRVALYDGTEGQCEAAIARIETNLAALEGHGLIDDPAAARLRISISAGLADALDGAAYAQESVFERADVKRAVYEQIDHIAGPELIVASSSSGIPASTFTEGLGIGPRCLIAHPINPPYVIPLVEIVPAPWTEEEAVSRCWALMEAAGMEPVRLTREIDGFIANPVSTPVEDSAKGRRKRLPARLVGCPWRETGIRRRGARVFRRERAAEPCRAQAVRARRPPAGRHGLSGWGRSRHPGLRGALPAGAGRRRAAVQLSALFLRARLWLRR